MLCLVTMHATLAFFQGWSMVKFGQNAVADLRRDTYARLICLP